MNMRRFAKPVAALLLALGVATVGVSASDGAVAGPSTGHHDTGWG